MRPAVRDVEECGHTKMLTFNTNTNSVFAFLLYCTCMFAYFVINVGTFFPKI